MKEITSMKDIADLCGVSYSTVSRVLSGKSYVKEETRQKVMEVVNKSNFKPNPLAQYLKSGESKTICLMLPSYGNLIFPIVMRGVDEVARKKGYKAFFSVTDEREEQEEALYKEMLTRQVAGFIICSAIGNEKAIYDLHDQGIPIVLVNRFQKEDVGKIETISIDNYQAGYNATSYLIRCGCKRIAIACGDKRLFLYNERLRGYVDALKANNLPYDPSLVLSEPPEGQEAYYNVTKRIMLSSNHPDAFFATSDPKAFIIMRALHDLHLRIPEEVSVISIDNVELSAYMEPPLTTISQPLMNMGEIAMEQILQQIRYKKENGVLPAGKNITLDYDLIIRQSTK